MDCQSFDLIIPPTEWEINRDHTTRFRSEATESPTQGTALSSFAFLNRLGLVSACRTVDMI